MKKGLAFLLVLAVLAGAGLANAGPNILADLAQARFGLTSGDLVREYRAARISAIPAELSAGTQVVLVGMDASGGVVLVGHKNALRLKIPLAGRIHRLENGWGMIFFPNQFPQMENKLLFIFVFGLPVNYRQAEPSQPAVPARGNYAPYGAPETQQRKPSYGGIPRDNNQQFGWDGTEVEVSPVVDENQQKTQTKKRR